MDNAFPERWHGLVVHVWDGDRKRNFQMHDWRINAKYGERHNSAGTHWNNT